MIAARLLRWYDRHKRALPWRAEPPDPYRVWLSEIMLQQTRIEVVRGYYARFLERFPTVHALARAPEADVLHAWAGLGYYSRARNLHRAARVVADRHGGAFPSTVAALRALPGVGPYTAGAIASIAFGVRAPVVDGNVARVLARFACVPGDPREPAVSARLWSLAGSLVPARRPGDFNQALMELGETVCTPRAPRCTVCPLRTQCGALPAGRVAELPTQRRSRARPEVTAVCALVRRGDRILLARRVPSGLLGGLWEPPGAEVEATAVSASALARALRERLDLRVRVGEVLGSVRHVFTHRALTLTVFACTSPSGRLRPAIGYDDAAWVSPGDETRALSSLARKALALADGCRAPNARAARGGGQAPALRPPAP